jgi:hypothetical protein
MDYIYVILIKNIKIKKNNMQDYLRIIHCEKKASSTKYLGLPV